MWTSFPVLYVGSALVALAAFRQGYSPALVVTLLSGGVGLTLLVLERLRPHAHYWNKTQADVSTDVTHVVFSTMLVPAIFEALLRGVLLAGAAWLTASLGGSLWPHAWPIAVQLALALVVAEFGQYWWHRWAHERDALWRFHATHHSPSRLYWLNSCRFHPVDSMAQYALQTAPLVVLGAGPDVLGLFTLSVAVIGMFQHANIELRIGVLNWIFSLTELHRWHHSRDLEEANANYGANLIVWDVVFGTRCLPSGRELSARNVGLSNMPNFPQRYWGQLLSPLRWRQLRNESQESARADEISADDASHTLRKSA
jgi:sterol desaturase/sphingolipid hydroxylase (fatty acid hydroxylase superfamily)